VGDPAEAVNSQDGYRTNSPRRRKVMAMILISLLMGLWKRFTGKQEARQAPVGAERDGDRDSYLGR
jgi:hypothetical protein